MEPKTVGERLREMREARGVSQQALGERIGRPQAWISNRERDTVETPIADVVEIAQALGYVAEIVILPRHQRELLEVLAGARPEDVAVALRFLAALPRLEPSAQRLAVGLVDAIEREALAASPSAE